MTRISSLICATMNQQILKTFSVVFVVNGNVRRAQIEAADDAEARATCLRWNVGLEGEVARARYVPEPLAEAYDSQTARRLLGGISRTSLYKQVAAGNLDRVPGTRRVLITRSSIERRCR